MKSDKVENILRNLRDLQVRSQRQDEAIMGKGCESMMTQLIDLVAELAEEIVDDTVTITVTDIER